MPSDLAHGTLEDAEAAADVSMRSLIRPGLRGALALTLALGGCAWDGPMSTVVPRSDFARDILHVYSIITWITIGIALLVGLMLAWVLARFRARPGTAGMPAQTRGHTLLEISWTIGPAIVLLVIAIPTIQVIFRTQAAPPRDALEVTVRGHQWWWEFQYPALQIVTANELHVPAGRPVALVLDGPDVIHSFWVPQLGGKRDVVPGRLNRLTFTAETPGEYRGQCAEFCGVSHANMGMRVIVDAPDAFARWVAAQKVEPPEPPAGRAAEGKAIYAQSACVGCHTIRGVSSGALGPDLTRFGSRHTLAAGILPNTVENVAAWIKDPPAIKPDAKMPALGLTDEQARAVATYLIGLK
jgi:cytochrome c oxidase subunit 2